MASEVIKIPDVPVCGKLDAVSDLAHLCFFKSLPWFPDVDKDTKLIPTAEFLDASKGIIQFVDLLGLVFKPVSKDLKGYVAKITDIFNQCPDDYKYLNGILKAEKSSVPDGKLRIGSHAICWMNRCLKYLALVLTFLAKDYVERISAQGSPNSCENLTTYFSQAYELTLKSHHSWFVQKVFNLCLTRVPYRKDLIRMLMKMPSDAIDNQDQVSAKCEETLFVYISNYLVNLRIVNDTIDQLFIDHDIKI